MISAFTFKELSLILVPALTALLILAIVIVLWPNRAKNKLFILCQQIILTRDLLNHTATNQKTLKKIFKRLKFATEICGELVGDEFYELGRVCERITECFNIVAAVRVTKNLSGFSKYERRLKNGINEAVDILKELNLIPSDISKREDELIKKTKLLFSQRYKVSEAKNYLDLIESEENLKDQ